MNFSGVYQRERRYPSQMYHPMHNSIASYWTEALQKTEMKHDFADEIYLNNIHLIPDPLKKNLADTLFTNDTPKKLEKVFQQDLKMTHDHKVPLTPQNMPEKQATEATPGTTLGGIGSFFSGVLNVLTSVMFRNRSPVNNYDCFDVDGHQGSPPSWRRANTNEQDKNGQAEDQKSYDAPPNSNVNSDMNFDSRARVTSCESKRNQVLHLLPPRPPSNPVWVRKRPKKVYVQPGSVGESFEDAFAPEDFVSLPNNSHIEFYSPVQYHCEDFHETAAQKTKLNMAPVNENFDIVEDVTNKSDLELKRDDSQLENDNVQLEKVKKQLENDDMQLEKGNYEPGKDKLMEKSDLNMVNEQQLVKTSLEIEKMDSENESTKLQLVSSCEDKLSRLKALLQEKRMKCSRAKRDPETSHTTPPKTIPTEKKTADKRFKNPNRRCSKRSNSKLKCRIEDDLVYANEISLGTPPSTENSPVQPRSVNFGDYFDEVSGRFRTASTGSDDSFQIVFNDCPKSGRIRTTSDCDSEDSFIVFEDSPESCYVSNDVFGESSSDSESGMSDSGCGMVTCKLAHPLTRTITNLADDSLYAESEDEVDFANIDAVSDIVEERKSGLLLDEKKKLLRKCQPAKTVHFSTEPPKVHVMRVWAFAARQARAGHWERFAVDRERFKRRITDVDMALSWVLKPQHRRRVMFQRFMPWWNQLKRKELAEKKEREAEEKRKEEDRREEEERKNEEDRLEAERERSAENIDDSNVNESKSDEGEEIKKTSEVNKAGDRRQEEERKNEEHRPDADRSADNVEKSESDRRIEENKKIIEVNNESQIKNVNDTNVQNEARRVVYKEDDNKMLEFNNNKIFNDSDDGEISNLITQNDEEIVKKIQDLEVSDKGNLQMIKS